MIWQRSGPRMKLGLSTDKWKRCLDDYVESARELCASVAQNGIQFGVPIDPQGELLDGSHRLAIAAALNHERVPVSFENRFVWAPTWNHAWFHANGVAPDDMARIEADWFEMRNAKR